jgi:hypothetical protein
MSYKSDSKVVAKDLAADVRDAVLEWFPSVLRFGMFVVLLQLVVGMEHQTSMEVAALLAFADVATHRTTSRTRVRDDVKHLYRRDGSLASSSDTHESDTSSR